LQQRKGGNPVFLWGLCGSSSFSGIKRDCVAAVDVQAQREIVWQQLIYGRSSDKISRLSWGILGNILRGKEFVKK